MQALEAFTGMRVSRAKLPLLWDDIGTLEALAHRVRTVLGPLLEQTVRAVRQAGEGEAFDRFVAQTAPFVRKMAETADLMLAVVDAEKKFFVETEVGKRTALAMFNFMIAEFAVAAAMWFWNPVGAAAHIAQTRTIIQAILRSALVRSAASGTAMQMLFMPGSALLAEVSMMTGGLQPGVNWSTVGKQAAFAGAAAFLGTVGGPALGKVAGAVAGAVGKLGVSDATKHLLTDVLSRPVTETLGEGLFGIGAGLMVDGYYDFEQNLGADLGSGAISGAGGSAAALAGAAAGRAVHLPRVQVPHIAFTADGKPVMPVGPTPVGGDMSTGYQAGVDDPKPAVTGAQAPPPPPVPLLPASNLPTPKLDLPAPKLDLSVPSWSVSNLSMPAAPVPEWVAAAGGPVVEQWHGFQQDLADRYGGLLAGTGQARQFLAGLPVPVEQVFTEWADARQGDPAVPVFLSQVGLPATALTGQFLFGVRDRAVARVTETLAGQVPAGGQVPAAVRPEQVVAALPGEFDRQALRSIAHLAVGHHVDQYFTTGAPATAPLPGGVVPPGGVIPPGGAGVPGLLVCRGVPGRRRHRRRSCAPRSSGTCGPTWSGASPRSSAPPHYPPHH
ncbi:hypothetical protein [Micromonospora olivasterospora]|uniref:hypothetical protein n=1 Tax=Micromonospora olivasterospora TaxID=1880 RepID=UPI001B87A211|nr:hypothetical protein [Micromonospora olivasterospora]